MEQIRFFAMLSRMKYISRWGLMRNTVKENIAEHSLETAMIAHGLAVIKNTYFEGNVAEERIALLALYHDASEIITGDLPTPIKYYAPEIRDAYKKVEDIAAHRLIEGLPEEMRSSYESIMVEQEDSEEWRIVKAADRLSALIKCMEEVQMGNLDFTEAEKTVRDSLVRMHLPEVDFFMERVLPSYGLTLDELSEAGGDGKGRA